MRWLAAASRSPTPHSAPQRFGHVIAHLTGSFTDAPAIDLVENRHEHVLTLVVCDLVSTVAADDEMAESLERASRRDPEPQRCVEFAEAVSAIRAISSQ